MKDFKVLPAFSKSDYSIFREDDTVQAYEFYTKPKDGMIHIPEQFKNQITDNVLVIVIEKKPETFDSKKANAQKKTDLLSPPSLKTKGWKFNREEANAR